MRALRELGRDRRVTSVAGAACLLIGISGFVLFKTHFDRAVSIPSGVVKSTPFAIYVPEKLPATYKLIPASFQYTRSQGVLVFEADDQVGDKIAFAEQPKPKSVNFQQIYSKLFVNSSNLPNMPYPSTIGSTLDRQTSLLSVITPDTWLIVTTQAGLNDHDMQTIAQSITPY